VVRGGRKALAAREGKRGGRGFIRGLAWEGEGFGCSRVSE
jgi:hypothetical protein